MKYWDVRSTDYINILNIHEYCNNKNVVWDITRSYKSGVRFRQSPHAIISLHVPTGTESEIQHGFQKFDSRQACFRVACLKHSERTGGMRKFSPPRFFSKHMFCQLCRITEKTYQDFDFLKTSCFDALSPLRSLTIIGTPSAWRSGEAWKQKCHGLPQQATCK